MAKFKKPKPLYRKRPVTPELPGSARGAIQVALERWASPAIPDYASFGDWLAEKLTIKDRDLVLPQLRTGIGSETTAYVQALLDLHKDYERRVRAANETHATTGESYRLLLNGFKLLIHCTEGLSGRTKETFALATHLGTSTERLDKDLSSCSQSELRARFFTALQREDDRVALKLLGRLCEQDHDPGELPYLEALCHFHANEFSEAIYWAKRVPVGTIDYKAARAVILEAQAFLADTNGLIGELQAHQPNEITPSFLAYLIQVSIRQSDDPDEAVAAFNKLGKQWSPKALHITSDPFYAPFNRYSCRIAKELAIGLQGLENQQEYTQAVKDQSVLPEQILDVHTRRVLYGCKVDSALLDDLLKAESDARFVPIVKRLLNAPYCAEFADFAESLRIQWELGAIDIFVENVTANLQSLLGAPDEAKWDLIELAYTEASATNHQGLPTLRLALEEHGRLVEQRKSVIAQNVQSTRLRRDLTPTGWHFFQQAIWAHERSIAERSPWQDAGMISLGFFRILEVELNQRIIAPLAKSLDFDALRALPKPTKERMDEIIPDNIIEKLGHVRNGRDRGLELGALYLLLERTQTVIEPDKDRKRLLHDAISKHLTTAGKAAFEEGRLSAIINPAAREQYRNPPAHSRFLPQAVATKCKEHVEQALLEIIAWIPKP